MAFWGQNPVGQSPVIGNQYKTFCIFIQPACWEQTLPAESFRHKIQHCRQGGVFCGTYNAFRLIQHQIGKPGHFQPVPVYCNLILSRHFYSTIPHRGTIHKNQPPSCKGMHFFPGVAGPVGYGFVKPFPLASHFPFLLSFLLRKQKSGLLPAGHYCSIESRPDQFFAFVFPLPASPEGVLEEGLFPSWPPDAASFPVPGFPARPYMKPSSSKEQMSPPIILSL